MSRTTFALLMLACLAPLAGAEDTASFTPRLAVASPIGSTLAAVSWLPGDVAPDSYRVYGLDAVGGATLLLDTADTPTPATLAASVPAGFPTYSVSGVRDGAESPRVVAIQQDCVIIQTYPSPGVRFGPCIG